MNRVSTAKSTTNISKTKILLEMLARRFSLQSAAGSLTGDPYPLMKCFRDTPPCRPAVLSADAAPERNCSSRPETTLLAAGYPAWSLKALTFHETRKNTDTHHKFDRLRDVCSKERSMDYYN